MINGHHPTHSAARSVAFGLYVLVVMRPVSNNQTLVPLLAAIAIMALVGLHSPFRSAAKRHISATSLIAAWVGAMVSFHGALRDNPGWIYGLITYVGGPVFWLLVAVSATRDDIRRFFRLSPYLLLYLSLGLIYTTLERIGQVPSSSILLNVLDPFNQSQGANALKGVIEARFYGISSILMLLPLAAVMLIVGPGTVQPTGSRLDRAIVPLSVIAGVAAALVSGRRIAFIAIAVSVITCWYVLRQSAHTRRVGKRTWTILISLSFGVVVLSFLSDFSASEYIQSIQSALDPSGEGLPRAEQTSVLMAEFGQRPIFGHGAGATIEGYFRNLDRPWNFESQYPLYLFQMGIIGAGVLAYAGYRGARSVMRCVRTADPVVAGWSICALAPAIAVLVANITNPYLQAVGHQWALWLPLAVVGISDVPIERLTQRPSLVLPGGDLS